MTAQYLLHGLHILSEIALPEPEAPFPEPADLVIVRGDDAPVEPLPDARAKLRFRYDADRIWYEASHDDDRWCLRVPDLFAFTTDGTRAVVQRAPGSVAEYVPMLTAGVGLAFSIVLRGHLCVHASAVEAGGAAVALCAPSGCGKSTLAALAAAAGHPLVADDLLRVDVDGPAVTVTRGASEIRLREGAAALREVWPGRARATIDGRTAVAPPRTRAERLPLATVVMPVLERDRSDVAVERLRPADAFRPLLACQRLLGWRAAAVVTREFEQVAALADRVPVVVARVPWHTPADPDLGALVVARALDAC